jgi:O-succinylbenzoate synthase
LDELKELNLPIPVVGDEVIRKAADPFKLDLNGAVDILMLKVSPLGGIARAKAIAAHHKLPVVVSSALESAVGISHGLRLAASLPELNYACGLGTGKLLTNDVAELPIVDGRMKVTNVNPSGLLNYQAAPDRITWWQKRIRDSFEVWQARN